FYVTKHNVLHDGRFLSFECLDYQTPKGIKHWECISRKSKKLSGLDVDAVELVPIIYYPISKKPTSLIFIREFRVPVNAFVTCKVYQLAAGLIDPHETVESSAFRELKEETGYVAEKVLHVSKRVAAAPAESDTYVQYVSLLVNGDAEVNQHPVQELEPSEEVTVHVLPLDEVEAFLAKKSEEGETVEARLFCFACNSFIMNYKF
ncbi:muT/nudix family protein, partial [Entamoeba invadens IP1]